MEVDQDNTCHMKMMKKMIIVMVMIMMLIISVTQSIFKQGDLYPHMCGFLVTKVLRSLS